MGVLAVRHPRRPLSLGFVLESDTGSTDAVTPCIQPRVLDRELVTPDAMRLRGPFTAPDVHSVKHRLQMIRIHTTPHPTQVIQLVGFRDRRHQTLEQSAMGHHLPAIHRRQRIAVMRDPTLPQPASVLSDFDVRENASDRIHATQLPHERHGSTWLVVAQGDIDDWFLPDILRILAEGPRHLARSYAVTCCSLV